MIFFCHPQSTSVHRLDGPLCYAGIDGFDQLDTDKNKVLSVEEYAASSHEAMNLTNPWVRLGEVLV